MDQLDDEKTEGSGTIETNNGDSSTEVATTSVSSSFQKIVGETGQTDAVGVQGRTTASTSVTHGVVGKSDSSAEGSTGVTGKATSTDSTETYGVQGISEADWDDANNQYPAGVFGTTNGSGRTIGVEGRTSGPGAAGMYAVAADPSFERDFNDTFPTGLTAVTTYSSDMDGAKGAAAIEADASASSGTNYGILASTQSPDGYGVFSDGDSGTVGTHEVTDGTVHYQRDDPSTAELPDGAVMTYNSDGSGTGSAGDLVYAVNDGGTIKTQVIAQRSNATT